MANANRRSKFNENSLYQMRFMILWKLANNDLTPNNEVLFADPSKFDKSSKEFC